MTATIIIVPFVRVERFNASAVAPPVKTKRVRKPRPRGARRAGNVNPLAADHRPGGERPQPSLRRLRKLACVPQEDKSGAGGSGPDDAA